MEDLVTDDSYQFAQCDGCLPPSWIIIDTGSTSNVFSNRSLLKNVRRTNWYMHIQCNARWSYTNQMGELLGYHGKVWYNPCGIVNILCFADVCNHFRIRFDSAKERAFLIDKLDGTTKGFVQFKAGLYFHDTTNCDTPTMCNETPKTSFLTMVADNKSRYTDRMYAQAYLAQKLQAMIGYPSTWDFLQIVNRHLLPDCPITRADILTAKDIFGLNVHSLKGKTVQQTEPHVASSITPIPANILSLYWSITLCMDIMFVNKLPFLVTISHHLKFGTSKLLLNH